MDTRSILEALGVPLVTVPKRCDHNRIDDLYGPEVDCSPDTAAELRWVDGGPKVCWNPHFGSWANSIDGILHEALHAVVGPHSLEDEELLMAYQAEIIACCTVPKEHQLLRTSFANYGFPWRAPKKRSLERDIGLDDIVFESRAWKQLLKRACEAGLLVRRRGRLAPVFGLGVHPSWTTWARTRPHLAGAAP